MIGCDQQERCEFYFDLSSKLGLVVFFITEYCHSPGYQHCARHQLERDGAQVPSDLYPNQLWRVRSFPGRRTQAPGDVGCPHGEMRRKASAGRG